MMGVGVPAGRYGWVRFSSIFVIIPVPDSAPTQTYLAQRSLGALMITLTQWGPADHPLHPNAEATQYREPLQKSIASHLILFHLMPCIESSLLKAFDPTTTKGDQHRRHHHGRRLRVNTRGSIWYEPTVAPSPTDQEEGNVKGF